MLFYQVRFATEQGENHLWFESSADTGTYEGWQQIVRDCYAALEQLVLLEEHQKLSWLLGRVFSESGVPLGRLERIPLSRVYPELSAENQDGLLSQQLERWHQLKPRVLRTERDGESPYSWHGNGEIIPINPSNHTTAATLAKICSSSMGNINPSKLSQRSLGAWLKHHLDIAERESKQPNPQIGQTHVSTLEH